MAKKKPRKRPKYNLKSRITSALRRIWFFGPQRREAAKTAKASGNICTMCNLPKDKLQIDHLEPVVSLDGFKNWDEYIQRLFVDASGLRGICEECHKVHTRITAGIRKVRKNEHTD